MANRQQQSGRRLKGTLSGAESNGCAQPLSRRQVLAATVLGAWGAAATTVLPVGAQQEGATPVAATPLAATPATRATPVAALEPRRGGTMRLLRPGSALSNFNPAAFAQDFQIPVSYLEPLVRPDPETLRPTPWLAEAWSWTEGGLRLDLRMRQGAVWQDGNPVTAGDAVFSYEVYTGDAESAVAGLFALVDSIEATSDRDLVVRFAELDANWLFNAATLPIFSRAQYGDFWAEQVGRSRTLSGFDWESSPPIGSGPWQIAHWDETEVTFTGFGEYWGSKPWLDGLVVGVEEGRRNRLEAWSDGDAQVLWPVDVAEARRAGARDSELVAAPAAAVMFAAFNFFNPNQPTGSYWNDLNVRQAASLAMDRERYAEEVFAGHVRARAAGVVAQPWAHASDITVPSRNVLAAQGLLAEAGWVDYDGDGVLEDVNGMPFRPIIIAREGSRPELTDVLARVARDLFDVGIAATIEILPGPAFEERWISRRDYDLIAYGYDLLPGFTDYDLFGSAWDIRTNPAGWNPGGYSNPDADDAIADFLSSVSIERQREALLRLQAAVNDDLFGLWLGFPDDLMLVSDEVAGFIPDMAWQTAQTSLMWRTDTADQDN